MDGIATVKFVFITWVGENVKPMTKGKISTHKSTIEKAFHVSFLSCKNCQRNVNASAFIVVTAMDTSKSDVKAPSAKR